MEQEEVAVSLMELPPELQYEILLRLPAKSLLLCKCVCKSLRILIQNPNFVQTHLSCITLPQKTIILQFRGNPDPDPDHHFLVSMDTKTKTEISSLPLTPPIPSFPWGETPRGVLVGSCNGLILISVSLCTLKKCDYLLILWNPVIAQHRYLPKPNYSCFGVHEFAFVPETNDYVVLKISSPIIEVYKMSTDSWITIDCSSRGADKIRGLFRGVKPIFLNGSFHWGKLDKSDYDIVYYNLKDEELGVLKGLDYRKVMNITEHDRHLIENKLDMVDQSLAMIYWLPKFAYPLEVWVMSDYGVEDSWTLKFRILEDVSNVVYRNVVGYWTSGLMIILEIVREKDVAHCFTPLYDVNTGSRITIPRTEKAQGITGFCSFVETLVPVIKVD